MGEAKRRKQSDPNSGKNAVSVRLDSDLVLPSSLVKIQEQLPTKERSMKKGMVRYRDKNYPVVFVPDRETYRGKTQLYCHILFDPEQKPESLSQRTTDQISRLACLEIIAQQEKLNRDK